MPGRAAEVAAVTALAAIVTAAIAAPVLRAPSERVFGMEIVGRHHDPFTMMAQFERPITIGVYSQPVTDISGALLARLSDGVAAYNWLVLLSFPLSAAAAYLLARHLAISTAGATVAAMAFAFSPFHVAHAAYHPHVAQTQWLPLYLLALWRCLDHASPVAVGFLGAATFAVTLSNFYGGLIAAVITPAAVVTYWVATRRAGTRSMRQLGITAGSLLVIAACGMAYASYAAAAVVVNSAAFAYSRSDLFRYSAKWWSYLVPPVEHPLLGAAVHRVWTAAGVRDGLLEQQVSLGWGIVALGLIAVFAWLVCDRQPLVRSRIRSCTEGGKAPREQGATTESIGSYLRKEQRNWRGCIAGRIQGEFAIGPPAPLARVPVLVLVAVVALVCSLSPERTIGGFTFVRPSSLLYSVVPMFRSYARFGVVVQLMAALMAGLGVDHLRRTGTRRAQIVCLALVALIAGEYAVAPSALWRDVLPTTAHRWVTQQPGRVQALDCTPFNQDDSEAVRWLTAHRVTSKGTSTNDCKEPNLSQKLAAFGYTHLLVRRNTADGQWFAKHQSVDGLRVAADFDDGRVFAVTASMPAIYTATMTGFFRRELDTEWTWRWMGKDAAWTIVNTSAHPIVTSLVIELSAFHRARQMKLLLDGGQAQTLVVEPSSRRTYQIGPFTVLPGGHELLFRPTEEPTAAGHVINNGDRRRLSFALGTWSWTAQSELP